MIEPSHSMKKGGHRARPSRISQVLETLAIVLVFVVVATVAAAVVLLAKGYVKL